MEKINEQIREERVMEQNLQLLTQDTFQMKSRCAIRLLTAKLKIADAELALKLGITADYAQVIEEINDIIGIRAVCAFEDDIYRLLDVLSSHRDLRILKKKDYIRNPKSSGYRSFHLIVEVPVYFQEEVCWIRAEIQLRTTAMDFWAGVDHELRYKKGRNEAVLIGEELKEYSQVVAKLDQKMVELRRRIEEI